MQTKTLPSLPDFHKSLIAIGTVFIILICVFFVSNCRTNSKFDKLGDAIRQEMESKSEELRQQMKSYVDDKVDEEIKAQNEKLNNSLESLGDNFVGRLSDIKASLVSLRDRVLVIEESINDYDAKITKVYVKLDEFALRLSQESIDKEARALVKDLETRLKELELVVESMQTSMVEVVVTSEQPEILSQEEVEEPIAQDNSNTVDVIEHTTIVPVEELEEEAIVEVEPTQSKSNFFIRFWRGFVNIFKCRVDDKEKHNGKGREEEIPPHIKHYID